MENQKHYLAAIGAFVLWGVFAIPLRTLKDFSPGEILYFRIFFSALFLTIFLLSFKRSSIKQDWYYFKSLEKKKRMSVVWLTLFGGILLTLNWLIFIHIVNNINVKTASFTYLMCPVITAVLGVAILKEHLNKMQWLAVFICIISCALIGMSSFEELSYSFITALTYALYLITQRKNQGFDRMVMLAIQIYFSLFILSLSINLLLDSAPASFTFYGTISAIAILFTILPLFLNLYALNKVNSTTVGILLYINPLMNFMLAFTFFNEELNIQQLVGYSIIFVGLFLFNFKHIRKLQTRFAR
ncbi:EamA family transporter [Chondrinema litorale]|uniref:EamA family transporter n=1 Tax=Chondrinema litorale TaxID=2994555 RepID=UPI002542BE46|nr:EamA family transporter [Chondrinema litorale]UZR99494.1 EamA family transporter [Chondrinema litorale]